MYMFAVAVGHMQSGDTQSFCAEAGTMVVYLALTVIFASVNISRPGPI